MGLEIVRTLPLLQAAGRAGYRPRLWTFHPLAFNDNDFDILPLQEGWAPVLPPAAPGIGAVWLPTMHSQGPHVCLAALKTARERGFFELAVTEVDLHDCGSLPNTISRIACQLFPKQRRHGDAEAGWGLYPADSTRESSCSIVLNLIGAHGSKKGLTDAGVSCAVADRVAKTFPQRQFVLLLHARVCAGQMASVTAPNLHILIHLDCDPRVARLLHREARIITVEGGLAHAALYRGCTVILVGLRAWLNETAYLYDPRALTFKCIVPELTEDLLFNAIVGVLADLAAE